MYFNLKILKKNIAVVNGPLKSSLRSVALNTTKQIFALKKITTRVTYLNN